MEQRSRKMKSISSSSSSSSNQRADPDYNEGPQRQLQDSSSISSNKNKNMKIQMTTEEVGTSRGASGSRRRRGRPPMRDNEQDDSPNAQKTIGVTDERLSLSLRRSTRRRSKNSKNKDDDRHVKRTILSWLIDTKVIEQNRKVCYMNETRDQAMREGIIKRDGILCDCCHKLFTPLDFEIHAAGSDCKRPYENIFIEELQISLLSCLSEAWRRVEELVGGQTFENVKAKSSSSDKHDDACMICADGGSLLCCDICPSTYHQDCMDIDMVPEGAWLCPYCVCKFCGYPCGSNDYLITCFQCERRYHWECYQERNMELNDVNSPFTPLCEQSCKEVYEKLEKMVGVRKKLDEGFSWILLRRMDQEFGVCLSDLYQTIECHCKLAVARDVMEECFEPIRDRHTRINIIQNVVFNCESSYTRINFRGFYTAILEKDDEIISVASVRIHGTKLAEMPFIATRENYRSQGMCRRLMVAIESALCYLNIEDLLIPSIHERIGTWIERYGFQRIGPSLSRELRHWNTLTFHDSFRLQKTLAITRAMEVQETENNMMGLENNCPMKELFDLNLEPPEEDDMNDDSDLTSNNTE